MTLRTGLVSLAAGALGAREVTMTDKELKMADYNLQANFGSGSSHPELRERFRLRPLTWGDEGQIAELEPPYELLLGSDIMYVPDQILVSLNTVSRLCFVF